MIPINPNLKEPIEKMLVALGEYTGVKWIYFVKLDTEIEDGIVALNYSYNSGVLNDIKLDCFLGWPPEKLLTYTCSRLSSGAREVIYLATIDSRASKLYWQPPVEEFKTRIKL